MFPEGQETNSKEGVEFVVEELLDTMNVRVFLASETLVTFGRALESFVTQSQDEWKIIQRDGRHSEAPLATGNVEDDVVILPRVYLIGTEAEPVPITHGYVLRKAHLEAATKEVRKDLSSAPLHRQLRVVTATGRVGVMLSYLHLDRSNKNRSDQVKRKHCLICGLDSVRLAKSLFSYKLDVSA
ncbi:hypothetical protein K469DRAFT_695820 [Zopfia rhizophila CBS 207.26]|uniref:Uncharacterized protein n=1 Tax=Zopfia rhizophila CBS 207.26 TaxID=1314779 RepID=A0A6A6ELS3_9PEZI|nr:hypothetical protein K469DRAFT_695820 [Zopfia rhizophila CBS 207.26]